MINLAVCEESANTQALGLNNPDELAPEDCPSEPNTPEEIQEEIEHLTRMLYQNSDDSSSIGFEHSGNHEFDFSASSENSEQKEVKLKARRKEGKAKKHAARSTLGTFFATISNIAGQ